MKTPGRVILLSTCILLIVYGALSVLATGLFFTFASWMGSNDTSNFMDKLQAAMSVGTWVFIRFVLFFLIGAADIILGIAGIAKRGNPERANYFIISGFILCGLYLLALALEMDGLILSGVVLSSLFVVGGFLNRKAAIRVPQK